VEFEKLAGKELVADWKSYKLQFKRPGGTSRGVLQEKETWFIRIWEKGNPSVIGHGECGMFRGLSCDDVPEYEQELDALCNRISDFPKLHQELRSFPSIQFGLETALLDLTTGGSFQLFENAFSKGEEGIHINGLIWMGDFDFLESQIEEKLAKGFSCLKLKIGSQDFEKEYALLKSLRDRFPSEELTLRVDANGAYTPDDAIPILEKLSTLEIHSIEQPIKAGQWDAMRKLCAQSKLPIALDEELIGVVEIKEKIALLDQTRPPYIILKPSLVGGFSGCNEWISLAEERNIQWWITSALESNVGLNAITQFTQKLLEEKPSRQMPQGLGTGQIEGGTSILSSGK